MAMIESTPYRVYYLLNKSDNREVFNPINWNEPSSNSSDSDDDKKVRIHARFGKNNDFYSVVVVSVIKSDDCMYDYYSSDYEDNTDYREFKWDDIDEDIVEIVNRYYSRRETDRARIIRYADRIQAMYENPSNISFVVDIDGRPRVAISGLPYVRDNEVLDMDMTLSTLNESYFNICINDHNPNYRYPSCSMTNDELREIIEKAKKYDQLRDRIIRTIDNPDADQKLIESMMYTPYNPRW